MMLGKHYFTHNFQGQFHLTSICIMALSLLLSIPFELLAQPNIQSASVGLHTPETLIQEIFKGQGVDILSVNYQGNLAATGSYNNLESYIPIKRGILLTTGSADLARNPNNSQNAGILWNDNTPDVDLAAIASDPIEDVAFYEITFVPHFDRIAFRYAFASEEYPEYACTDFNDVFGFFLTGPNPVMGSYNATNIAWVPEPSDPYGIAQTNVPVSINSVNSNGIDPSNGCDFDFSQYHNVIANGDYPTYDGFIDPFWASADVIPCETYTIKIGIADVSDDELDSAIFLEGKSFAGIGPRFSFPEALSATYISEGCDNISLVLDLPFPLDDDFTFEINIVGDAINGIDVANIPTTLTIPAGATSTSFNITPLEDGIIEGIESIGFVVEKCGVDTLWLNINDQSSFDPGFPDTLSQCTGPIQIEGDLNNTNNSIFTNSIGQPIPEILADQNNNPPLLVSEIEVTGLPNFSLTTSNINSVCVELDHSASWHIDLYLRSPYGKIIELSSRNGSTGNDYQNCCFAANAPTAIGTANSPFIGEYLPEETFALLNEFGKTVNGTWALLVKDNTAGTQGTMVQWSIEFNTAHVPTYLWSPSTGLSCTTCPNPVANPMSTTTYTVTFNDSNGCELTNEVRVERELPTTQGISTPIDCPGNSSGFITTEILSDGVPPYSFNWGPLGSDSIVGPLPQGEYQVTVSDSNGCTGEQTIFLNDPDSINVSFEVIPPCSDVDNNGMLTAVIVGGQPEYEFVWNAAAQNATEATINNLSIGTYELTITDDLGCTISKSYELTSGDFVVDLLIENVSCNGMQDGKIIASPVGGTGPFEFILNGFSQGANNQMIGLDAGTFALEIFDNNGCVVNIPAIEITAPDSFLVDLGPDMLINLGEQPTLDIEIIAGQGNPADYEWNWAVLDVQFLNCLDCTTPRLFGLEFTRTFELTLVDTAGCSASDKLTISVNKPRRFFVPTGFTPNGDQLNDRLLTHGDEQAIVESFQLFDRWGALVFEASDFPVGDKAIGWDGKMLGGMAEPGVYVWIAQVRFQDDIKQQFNGESTLIR